MQSEAFAYGKPAAGHMLTVRDEGFVLDNGFVRACGRYGGLAQGGGRQ